MDRSPRRIVCLTEEPTEILCHLGEEDRIVGISGFSIRPKGIAQRKPKISAFTSARYDAICALEPELVIGFSDLQAELAAELVRRGVQVAIFNQRSVAEILSVITMIGALVGRAAEASAWADALQARLDAIAARPLPRRPRVYFEEWPDPMISGIRWVEELIGIAGGDVIFPELLEKGLAKDRIVDPAEVARRAPDLILASWCGKKVKKDVIRGRPGWDAIPAIVHDDLVELRSSEILQPGPAALTDGIDRIVSAIDAWARRSGLSEPGAAQRPRPR